MPPESAESTDGRQGRKVKSRLAICEACLDLIQEGLLQPSADRIAKRAGVSRRSIFNHFTDLAELYDAVGAVGRQRYAPLLERVSEREPIAKRLGHLIEVRSTFLEATVPITRALTAQSLIGPAVEQAIRVSREALTRHQLDIERLFRGELENLEAQEQSDVVEAMAAATSPHQWEYLRRSRGKSNLRARAIVERSLKAILRDAGVDV
jgi:TetR/AcrR family transcriptional regulator of autoinduction and epiphytic fitness